MLELSVSDRYFGHLGFLVIDSAYNGSSVGGVRILPDVSMAEIKAMAGTQTRKYLFTGIPLGGAKAGIVLGRKAARHREEALRAFGKAISGRILGGFWPGCDMGSSHEDIGLILQGAGLRGLTRQPDTASYTAEGLAASLDEALEIRNLGWSGLKIAVEGFGNVGAAFADLACAKGARIVSISNTNGSLSSERGLDVGLLKKLRGAWGSSFINHYPILGPRPKEAVFRADCDVFVPCARCWSVDSQAERIRARIIACGANVPMSAETERALWGRGKLIIPDAIANCGGVLGGNLERFLSRDEISRIFEGRFRERVAEFIGGEAPPSEYLDDFCSKRKEALSRELSPVRRGPLEFFSGALARHTTDRIFGKGRMVRDLFPG